MTNKISSYLTSALLTLALGAGLFSSCIEDSFRVVYPHSTPTLSGLQLSTEGAVKANEEFHFSVKVSDEKTPLSTLEVKVQSGDAVLYKESIRTKGNSAEIVDHNLVLPFKAGLETAEAQLTLTAINVEGDEASVSTSFTLERPNLPNSLYLYMPDGKVVTMRRSASNEYLYESTKGSYPQEFTAKIASAKNLDDAEFIWGASETPNNAELIDGTGAGFTFNFTGWRIDRVTFNTLTFELGVVGESQDYAIGDLQLVNELGLFNGVGTFEKGKRYTVNGFDDIAGAYNRDFFELNDDGTLTFLRDSGEWQITYSKKFNYIWVYRSAENAPDCYWLVGHGFTCASQWNSYYSDADGWNLEDITQMGYLVKIDSHKYQCTVYLNPDHKWSSFEVEIYSDHEWGKGLGMLLYEGSILGDNTGFLISQSNGFTSGPDFVAGYYRLTFDNTGGVGKETLTVKRIGD